MSNQVFPAAVRGLGFTVVKSPQDAVIVQQSPSFSQTRVVQNQNPVWKWSLLYDFLIDNPLKPNASLLYTDLRQMLGFITARRNSGEDFLFLDPDDNFCGPGVITQGWLPNYPFGFGSIIVVAGNAWQVSIAPAGAKSGYGQPSFVSSPQVDGGLTWTLLGAVPGAGWPNPQAQLQLVTDGTNFFVPIQINRAGQQFWEDIFDLAGGITVYGNGTVIPQSQYKLRFGGLSFSGFSSAGLYLDFTGSATPTAPITATFNYYYRTHFEADTQDFEKWANQWWTIGGSEGSKGKGELMLATSRAPVIPGGTPAPPFPPLTFPNGATNALVIYPGAVTLAQGSALGVPNTFYGVAEGAAGPGAWFFVQVRNQIPGSAGGQATFSGYADPGIPRDAIKGVYSYIPFTLITGPSGMNGTAETGIKANSISLTGTPNTSVPGSYAGNINSGGSVLVNILQSGVTAANLDFTTIQQACFELSSVLGSYFDKYIGNPMVVVYY